jgi:hypothetical protein
MILLTLQAYTMDIHAPYNYYFFLVMIFTFISSSNTQIVGSDNFIITPPYQRDSSIMIVKRQKDKGVLLQRNTQNLNQFFMEDPPKYNASDLLDTADNDNNNNNMEIENPTVTGTLPHQTVSAFLFTAMNSRKNKNHRV